MLLSSRVPGTWGPTRTRPSPGKKPGSGSWPHSTREGQWQDRIGAKVPSRKDFGSWAASPGTGTEAWQDRIMQRKEKPGQIPMILSCHDSVFFVAAVPPCRLSSFWAYVD